MLCRLEDRYSDITKCAYFCSINRDSALWICGYEKIYVFSFHRSTYIACSRSMELKCHRQFFSTFESIYLKYLKSLQSGRKSELSISNEMWQNVFIFVVTSYIFIFSATHIPGLYYFVIALLPVLAVQKDCSRSWATREAKPKKERERDLSQLANQTRSLSYLTLRY